MLACGYALKWADAQVLSVVLPGIKAEFGVSDTALGLLTGLPFAIFYSVLGVPIARLADRGSRRDIVAASLAAFSAATALAGAAWSFAVLFATRIAVGIGEAGATPPAQSMIADLVPPARRGFALSAYGVGLNVGVLFGFAVGGAVAERHGWRAACVVVGAPGLLVAALTRWTLAEPMRTGADTSAPAPPLREVFATLLGAPAYRHLVAATSLASLVGFAALAWLPTFLLRDHGLGPRESGLFLGLMSGIVGAAGGLLSGWLGDRLSRRDPRGRPWLLAGGTLLVFPFLLAFYLAPGRAVPALLFLPPALLGAAYAGIAAAIIGEIAPAAMRATALSIMLLIVNLVATAAGPMLVGLGSDLLAPRAGAESLRWALAASAFVLPAASFLFLRTASSLPAALRQAKGQSAPDARPTAAR